jgi:hypothetical protein
MSIESFPLPGAYNTRGGLAVYGPGTDGNVIITGTVVLNRDMYYNNLTIMGGAQLDTNGYRVFVKNTLNMADSTAVIGRLADTTSAGSILGGAPSGIKASDTLGGNGGLNPGENFFGEAEFYNFSQAIAGYKFDAVAGTLRFLMGGSGGASGTFGASGTTGSFTSGSPGISGSAGSLGTRPGFENVLGASGGMGYSGTSGSAGSPGVGGLGGAGGEGGAGGAGGGVVIISARNIIGSGIIRADGKSGSIGNPGYPGQPGTPGTPGNPGTPGQPAPDFYSASYIYLAQAAYNYSVQYSFTNPATGGNPRTTYNTPTFQAYFYYYYFTNYSYNSPTSTYNRPTTAYNRPTTAYNRPTAGTFNPRTPGPASVRWRTSNQNAPTPGNAFTVAGNAFTVPGNLLSTTPGNSYASGASGPGDDIAFNEIPGNARTTYNTIIPGNVVYAYNYAFQPDQFSIEPSQYFVGGSGGQGGPGGLGGIGIAGLPGSPGLNGYAGGGGVVLIITESDIPEAIEARAAAGTGDGGMATSGTVIIIKNEAVKDGN